MASLSTKKVALMPQTEKAPWSVLPWAPFLPAQSKSGAYHSLITAKVGLWQDRSSFADCVLQRTPLSSLLGALEGYWPE